MRNPQQGAALLLALLVIVLGGLSVFLAQFNRRSSAYDRDRITADALAQAKAALIGQAAGSAMDIAGTLVSSRRPGDLPCPDLDDDGDAEPACGNGAGTTGQSLRLGRLPWKDLGLPDLRDGSGERLWYAVSSNFKKGTRFNAPLNSDTPGTITLRDAAGRVAFDAAGAAGVVAVIFAPGPPLVRPRSLADGTPYRQDRNGGGAGQAVNYLDLGNGEDNAAFTDGSATDGFIAGPVLDAAGNVVGNDRLAWITTEELAPHLERRVAAEVAQCLREYSSVSGGRYPWPAAGSLGTAGAVSYADSANRRFGRVPNSPFSASKASAPNMDDDWTGDCNINSNSGWWLNWKEQVFYAIADRHKPASGLPAGHCGVSGYGGGSCLTLDGAADRQYVVLVAGRRLAGSGQLRSTSSQKNAPGNYLEGANSSDDDVFASVRLGPNGNDILKGAP
jgi:hypothetical protein